MKSLIHMVAAASLALGGFALTGCEESPQPKGENGTTAGGTGEFGESPARPGAYPQQREQTPATQPSTPAYSEPGQSTSAADENFQKSDVTSAPQPSAQSESPSASNKDEVNDPSALDDEESTVPSSPDQTQTPAPYPTDDITTPASSDDENTRAPYED